MDGFLSESVLFCVILIPPHAIYIGTVSITGLDISNGGFLSIRETPSESEESCMVTRNHLLKYYATFKIW